MWAFDVNLILAGVCGVAMVLGGIVLLYKGAITLAGAPQEHALSIEFRKHFRIATQVPALGIFVIGLGFIVVALYVSPKPPSIAPITVLGSVENVNELITVRASTVVWGLENVPPNRVAGSFVPDTKHLSVEVSAAGYESVVRTYDSDGGVIDLGTVTLHPAGDPNDPIPTDSANIVPVETAMNATQQQRPGGIW